MIPERLPDTPHREFHQALLAARRAPEDTVIQSQRHGDLQFLISKFHVESGTRTATFLTATAARDERHVQVCLYGLQGNMAGIDQQLPEILGGLELPKEPPVAQVEGETIVQDFRLGYCLATDEPGWQLRVFPVPDAGPGASTSVAVLARKNLECGITALCLPHLDDEAVLNAGFAAIGLPPIEPKNRTETPDTLAGLPARRFSAERRQGFRVVSSTVWLARRGKTAYLFMVLQERGILQAKPDKTAQDYKKLFSLLDRSLLEQAAQTASADEIAASLSNRGGALRLAGKRSEAIQDFDQATAIYTRLVEQEGRTELAWDLVRSLNGLAWLRATAPEAKLRDGARAVKHAARACELTGWEKPDFLATLAAAHAEAGDFEAAVKWQTKALELAADSEELKAELRSRLELYEAGKPYRQPTPSNPSTGPAAPQAD